MTTLPQSIESFLFAGPAHSLCGISVADSLRSLSLPQWWSETDEKYVRGSWQPHCGAGIESVRTSIREVAGRVDTIDIEFELEEKDGLDTALYKALKDELEARCGSPLSREKKASWFSAPKGHPAQFLVQVLSFRGNEVSYSRVGLRLSVDGEHPIKADKRSLFVDIEAVADICKTETWPQERCLELFETYFAYENGYNVTNEERDAFRSLLQSAHDESPTSILSRTLKLCELIDYDDLEFGRSSKADYLLSGALHFSLNLSVIRNENRGIWSAINVPDATALLRLVNVEPAERAAWMKVIVSALSGDEAASEKLKLRMVAGEVDATWDSGDEVLVRMFDIISAPDGSDLERLRFPMTRGHSFKSDAARAATFWWISRGHRPVHFAKTPEDLERPGDWRNYLALVKRDAPDAFAELFLKFCECEKFAPRLLRFVCDALADKTLPGAKTTWQVAGVTVTHSGKETGGRWTWKTAAKPR